MSPTQAETYTYLCIWSAEWQLLATVATGHADRRLRKSGQWARKVMRQALNAPAIDLICSRDANLIEMKNSRPGGRGPGHGRLWRLRRSRRSRRPRTQDQTEWQL